MNTGSYSLAFVLPVHNEEKNLPELYAKIREVCRQQGYTYEVIFVDDGSTDGSFAEITKIAQGDSNVRAVQFRRNFGQTAAMSIGIRTSRAPYIVTLDSDLQNDPADVPAMLKKMEEGFDVVSGWRKSRQDNLLKTIPSRIANRLISHVTGVRISDFGCTLKVYKREYLEGVPLYGEMHRFMPVFAAWHGAKVAELPVHHNPRQHGKSHYGIDRTLRVILDLFTVKFLHTYISRPMHFFGGFGVLFMSGGFVAGVVAVVLKLMAVRDFVGTPLPLLSVFLLTVGALFILMGLLAELLIRIYFSQEGRQAYHIHTMINTPSLDA